MTFSHLLDSLGVGRPLPDGSIWTRDRFSRDIGCSPSDLVPSRSLSPRQDRIALACAWALVLVEGRLPDGWHASADLRDLALRVAVARERARGVVGRLDQLGAMLTAWGIGGEALALDLLEQVGERLQAALEVQGWAGVCVVVREVVDG